MTETIDGLTQIIEQSASGKTLYRVRVRDNQIAVGAGWSFPEAALDLTAGLHKQAEWIEAWINRMEANASPTADQDGAT